MGFRPVRLAMLLACVGPLASAGRRLASRGIARAPAALRSSARGMADTFRAVPGAAPPPQMAPPLQQSAGIFAGKPEMLTGTVARVLFCKPGYNVYVLRTAGSAEVTLVSRYAFELLQTSGHVRVSGRWTRHERYGWQVQVERAEAASAPSAAAAQLLAQPPVDMQQQMARLHAAHPMSAPPLAAARPPAPLPAAARPPAPLPAAARPRAPTPAERSMVCRLSAITFRSDDGYTIARVLVDASSAKPSASSSAAALDQKRRPPRSKTVVVVSASALASVPVGEKVVLTGHWTQHPKYGLQFEAEACGKPPPPTSGEEVLALLSSGAIKGIGPALAARIVGALGEDSVSLLQNDPAAVQRLRGVQGIGAASFGRIADALRQSAHTDGLVSFCSRVGLTMGAALELRKLHGAEAEERVRENPYRLLRELPGTAFETADMVAAQLDTPHGAGCRLQAVLCHALHKAAVGDGHVYLPADALVERVRALAGVPASGYSPERGAIAAELVSLVESGELQAELLHADTTGSVTPDELRGLDFSGGSAALFAGADSAAEQLRAELAAALQPARAADAPGLAGAVRAASEASARAADALAASQVAVYLPAHYDDELRLSRAIRARLTTLHRGTGRLRAGSAARDAAAGAPPGDHAPSGRAGAAGAGAAGAASDPASLELNAEQRQAVSLATSGQRLVVLTGGPGTGKTHAVRRIVELWQQAGKRVALACPTARGAAVLSELTGLKASTVHRLLEFQPADAVFARDSLNTIDADAIVVDEASMLDASLAASLLDALPLRCTLLLVGDADQLPSVGAGQVLRDVLNCEGVERVSLREVFRYDGSGEIALNARLVNSGRNMERLRALLPGEAPEPGEMHGCKLVLAGSAAEACAAIDGRVLDWVEAAGYDLHTDLQVLSPTKQGAAGTHALNRLLQARLNPLAAAAAARPLPPGAKAQAIFKGDRVIQLQNDYEQQVFNGDVGAVVGACEATRRFTVAFRGAGGAGEGAEGEAGREQRLVEYSFGSLNVDIALAYALTVHKAQGSEYKVVVMPALPEHRNMLYRNLLYTAISRAKELLVLVGSPLALETCVREDSRLRRLTRLTHLVSTETKAIHEIDLDRLYLGPDPDGQ